MRFLDDKHMKEFKRLRRGEFLAHLRLMKSQTWLKAREEKLEDLLILHNQKSERQLIYDLLTRFNFLDSDRVSNCYISMFDQVVNKWGLDPRETIIAASTIGNDADSAQMVLEQLKPAFTDQGWKNFEAVNRLTKAISPVINRKLRNIVVVDEFAGTGTTMASAVRTHLREVSGRQTATKQSFGHHVFVCLIAAMEEAKAPIESVGAEVFSCLWLKKGISDHLAGEDLTSATEVMTQMERRLAPKIEMRSLPSFGHRRTEALYSMQLGNTPNSVFPVFWWPQLFDGTWRRTLLVRKEDWSVES